MPASPQRLALAIALISSSGFISQTFANDTVLTSPETGALNLSARDSLTLHSNASLTTAKVAVTLKGSTLGKGVVIDNAGSLISTGGRAIDSSGSEDGEHRYSILNRSGATIQGNNDALRIDTNFSRASLLIDNSGTIRSTGSGQGIDLDALRSPGVSTTVLNRTGGVIRGEFSDGIKTGAHATILNDGEISAGDALTDNDKFDGIDIDSAPGVVVTNHGTVSGGRHGITTDLGATLYNHGDVTGRNGSGFGSDGNGTVINYGTITGAYSGLKPNGDGDGVDIDLVAHIENYGVIEGAGAGGVDKNGFANGSEGIALGGGYVLNAQGARVIGADNALLVDDGSEGSGVAATTLVNQGSIEGQNGFGVKFVGEFDDRVINHGLISGSNGQALDLGAGNDSLTLGGASHFNGVVDGGRGDDRVVFEDPAGGSFGNSRNFEWLDVKAGSWTLTSQDDFSAGGKIFSGARLINQGAINGTLTVDEGGVYAGGGSVGNLLVNGTLQTDAQRGSVSVIHDLILDRGATLAYGVNADGSSAPLHVGGSVNLNGATLAINAGSGTYPWLSQYTVLNAGSVNGTFGEVTSDYAFLTPTLSYTPGSVELSYARNDVAFADYASSANGRSAALSLSQLKPGNTLYNALLNTHAQAAAPAIEQLAGSSNASLSSATLGATRQVGNSLLAAMYSLGAGHGLQVATSRHDTPSLVATGVPSGVRHLNDPQAQGRLWLQGIGSYGRLDGEHGSNDMTQRTQGGLLGADWALTPDWRMGLLGGYSKTEVDSRSMDGAVNSWHAGAYAIRQSGALALRLGAAYSGHNVDSKRTVAFDGFSDQPKGDYHANSQQAFAELGYALGSGRLTAEPFVNLGYQRYHRERYTEKGGAAALRVEAQTQENASSTLGVRLAHMGHLQNGMSLTPRLSAGWKHTYGDTGSSTRQAFVLGGSAFNVEGSSLDRNSLVLEAGLDLGLSAHQTLAVGYTGDIGSNSRNHGLMGQWQLSF